MPKTHRSQVDQIFKIINQEKNRQQTTLGLIPSENIVSPAVRKAVGSVLMHKYAEGQVKKRYYQGNQFIDEVESLCKTRALKAFHLKETEWGVNVQPHSGCPANLAVYNALLQPGDKIMSMFLLDGGHLSHGWQLPSNKVTLVSKFYNIEFYHVDAKTKVFDYDQLAKQARKFKPQLLVSGGTAYAREIDHQKMGEIAHSVGAFYLADVSHEAGLIAAQVNGQPFPAADVVTCTTHKTLRGPRGAMIFSRKCALGGSKTITPGQDLTKLIDRSVFPGLQGGPHLHSIAGIAVALEEAAQPAFKQYAKQILKNAQAFVKVFLQHDFEVVSGGTDKHLVLLDLRNKEVAAWVVAWALEAAGIILNRNTVPNDTASPYLTSGLRLGSPIITTRGMKEPQAQQIANWIVEVIEYCRRWPLPVEKQEQRQFLVNFKKTVGHDPYLKSLRVKVKALALKYPLFAW